MKKLTLVSIGIIAFLVTEFIPITCLAASASRKQSPSDEWTDPYVNEVNRAPMHSNFFSFESVDKALQGKKENSRNFMTLDGIWNFNWVTTVAARPKDFYKKDFNDKGWDKIPVPGMWQLYGYADPIYVNQGYPWRSFFKNDPPLLPEEKNYVGSYRRSFEIPANWNGKEIIAHFGSMTACMYLWVNGKYVGYSEDSKLEAEFDITKYLTPGKKNLIAFQIYRFCDGTYLEDQDFWRMNGVARESYLYTRNKNHIQDIRVNTNLDDQYKDANLQVKMNVKGSSDIEIKLLDAKGNSVAEKTIHSAGRSKKVNDFTQSATDVVEMKISNPLKWSAEIPNLYTLLVINKSKGNINEVIPLKVGFRDVKIVNSQLLVNGQAILIKGADRHELDPDGGYVVSEERMIEDIQLMKKLNINAVRTSHYPDDNRWYDLCDKYGIYLVSESNLESHGMGYGPKTLAKNEKFALAHMERNERNLQRNYNHPSVIIWSMGNEAGMGPNFENVYRWLKKEDTSRPVQYERAGYSDYTDIFCPMYANYAKSIKYCEDPSKDKPFIQCEYAHAMGNSEGGFKEYWELIRKYPKYQGGFIWDFVDQGMRRYVDGGKKYYYAYAGDYNKYDSRIFMNFLDNGLVSPDRVPNPHAYEVQYYYQNIWAEPKDLSSGDITVYNENFFRNLKDYELVWCILSNGKSLSTGVISDLDVNAQSTSEIHLPYDLSYIKNNGEELLLNVEFRLKKADQLLTAGTVVARRQMVISNYNFPKCEVKNVYNTNNTVGDLTIKTNQRNYLTINGDNFSIDFNKNNGYLTKYVYNGKHLMKERSEMVPNFWRASTDNDFGAKLQMKLKAWRNPISEMTSFDYSMKDGMAIVKADYSMKAVNAILHMTYTINNQGVIKVEENMQTLEKEAKMPYLQRFGMCLKMPYQMDVSEFYGRGPQENYSDRNNSTFIGHYKMTADEQYHPYIRPQETGNKTDIRWWNQTDLGGYGFKFISEAPLSMSALHYSMESLDEGDVKSQGHGSLVEKADYTNVCIDKVQSGLACVNSWGAVPIDKYRLPYKDYNFVFMIIPNKL